jgi:hypothetical protein
MGKAKVMSGSERKALLLDVAAKLTAKYGAVNVTRRMVAKAGKVSEPLVSSYFGGMEESRKAYARHAKKLGLEQPSKEKQAALGAKLRAHGPRDARDSRQRSVKEVKAIAKKKVATRADKSFKVPAAKLPKPAVTKLPKPTVAKLPKPGSAPALSPPKVKSAARAPKSPPVLPVLPTL